MRVIRLLFSFIFLQIFSLSVFCANQVNLKNKQHKSSSIEINSLVFGEKIKELGSNLFEYGFGSSLFEISSFQALFLVLSLMFGFFIHFTPARRFLQISKDQGNFSEGIIVPLVRGGCIFLGSIFLGSILIASYYFLLESDLRYKYDFLYNFSLPLSLIILAGMARSCMSPQSLFNIDETKRGVFSSNLRMFIKGAFFSSLILISFGPLIIHFEDFIFSPSCYSLLIVFSFSIGLLIPFVMVSVSASTAPMFAVFSPIVKFISSVIGWIIYIYMMLIYRFFSFEFCDCYCMWNLIFVLLIECGILELVARWRSYTKVKILLILMLFSLVVLFLFGSQFEFIIKDIFSGIFDQINISTIALK